ncbi:MAG TPA: transposase [Tepidisphaeraceae bacterium]
MPRHPRAAIGGLVYHVLNRANARRQIFFRDNDSAAFERTLAEALARRPLELFWYCLMPNHWHLVARPKDDGDLSQFMRWLTVTHTQRWHACHHTSGSGHLYQGRFKSFPVEADQHFLTLCRYVERNALRAGLWPRAQDWRWSSLWRRRQCERDTATLPGLSAWPVEEPVEWAGAGESTAVGVGRGGAAALDPQGPAIGFARISGVDRRGAGPAAHLPQPRQTLARPTVHERQE